MLPHLKEKRSVSKTFTKSLENIKNNPAFISMSLAKLSLASYTSVVTFPFTV